MEVVVGITGASGVIYGIRLLEVLNEKNVRTHLIITRAGKITIGYETGYKIREVEGLAYKTYSEDDLAASIASGTYQFDSMVVAPCSMKTLSGIVHGYSDNLLLRVAEVALKEGRKLILVPRETPLSVIHLENMLKAARAGAIIIPAMPAFYTKPRTIKDIVDYVVGRILDAMGIEHSLYPRWGTE